MLALLKGNLWLIKPAFVVAGCGKSTSRATLTTPASLAGLESNTKCATALFGMDTLTPT